MGIYGALSTAVTGLRAQSFALENVSGNIANSQTTGFKRIDTDFVDLIPDAPRKLQSAIYSGPITITNYQKFQYLRDTLAKDGISLGIPN